MKYVVMECNTSYAVVLAEDGRFLNVANMNYQVGQTVSDVFAMDMSHAPVRKHKRGRIFARIIFLICLTLIFVGVFQYISKPYASVYMSINPSVRIDVKKDNTVMDIVGLNSEGVHLVEGYVYGGKYLEIVVEELLEISMNKGYLSESGEVRITIDADEDEWERHMGQAIKDGIYDKLSINVNLGDEYDDDLSDDDDDNDYDDDDDDDEEFDD